MGFRPRARQTVIAVAALTVPLSLPLLDSAAAHTRPAASAHPPSTARQAKRRPQGTTKATTPTTRTSATPPTTSSHPAPAPRTSSTPRAATSGTGAAAFHKRRAKSSGGIVALSITHDGKLVADLAHAAADIPGSIVDFSFSPATITIHVGDTVTWTNTGHQPHTATADNGSFNTGILRHGQSGSHTFTTTGTFTYFCQVHPYMKGTIVVLASTTTTTPTTSTSHTTSKTNTATNGTTGTTTSSGPSLPYTGMDVGGLVLGGALLTGVGMALRRRLSS